jgi:PAS domain S-box-containing protein
MASSRNRALIADVAQKPGNDESPFLEIRVDTGGKIHDVNHAAEERLGRRRSELVGASLGSIIRVRAPYSLTATIAKVSLGADAAVMPLVLQHRDGRTSDVLAGICRIDSKGGDRLIRISALDDSSRGSYLRELESRVEMLAGFVDASAEAMWCMEYTEPVNLRCGVQEIIRQVFENDCHWRMCNDAMARLYNLPEGLDFNRQPVSTYFRRTPENEAFVRQLIDARFHIDAAPSLEYRHDGKIFYVENSVRCHLEGDLMMRMWGTVRDITDFRTTQNALNERKREVTEILSALPDAVLVIDLSRRAVAMNPAFGSTFGWAAEEVLGKDVSAIIDLETSRPGLGRWFATTSSRWVADVISSSGQKCRCDVRMAPLQDDLERRFVLSMRPMTGGATNPKRAIKATVNSTRRKRKKAATSNRVSRRKP